MKSLSQAAFLDFAVKQHIEQYCCMSADARCYEGLGRPGEVWTDDAAAFDSCGRCAASRRVSRTRLLKAEATGANFGWVTGVGQRGQRLQLCAA